MRKVVGLKLQQERQARGLTLEQAFQSTCIRVHYLQALEEGDFESIPSMVQARGFLRAYAGFLGLDAEALLSTIDAADQGGEIKGLHQAALAPEPAIAGSTPIPVGELPEQAPAHQPDVEPRQADFPTAIPSALPPPAHDDQGAQAAATAFGEVGKQLRRQRELLGLSLDDVERHTHLRQHYLRALEAGDLKGLPSPVQGRGMLKNYAVFLGLDPEPVLLRFAEGLQARLAKQARPTSSSDGLTAPSTQVSTRKFRRRMPSAPFALRRLFSGDVLIGVVLILFLVFFSGWVSVRIYAMRTEQTPTATAPSIADVLLATPTATASFTPLPATPEGLTANTPLLPPEFISTDAPGLVASGEPLPPEALGKVQIYVTVHQRTWMRVSVDGEVEFEGRVIPGSAYPFVGDTQVEILTGNGAALRVYFNQRDLGQMGTFGQVINRIFSLQGIVTPTPTVTVTPTVTPPASATSTATVTPRPGAATAPALP